MIARFGRLLFFQLPAHPAQLGAAVDKEIEIQRGHDAEEAQEKAARKAACAGG